MSDALPTDEYTHLSGSWHWHGKECRGADDASFVPHNNVWATDKKGLFKQDARVRVKDPASCQVLNLLFAKDIQQVYYIMGTAKAIEDVATFEVLDSGRYLYPDEGERRFGFARDKKNVYCHDFFSGAPKILKGANRDTFRRLDYGFATDDKYVWREFSRIPKAEPKTFTVIDDLYSKDSRHVFYDASSLEAADSKSFEVIARTTAIDATHVYFQRHLLQGADPNTFGLDPPPSFVGRDATRVFWGSQLVEGAGPDTFEQIGDSAYYRDKHTIYYFYEPIEGVDVASFELVDNAGSRARDKHREYRDGEPIRMAN
jgi:hypothetical protein